MVAASIKPLLSRTARPTSLHHHNTRARSLSHRNRRKNFYTPLPPFPKGIRARFSNSNNHWTTLDIVPLEVMRTLSPARCRPLEWITASRAWTHSLRTHDAVQPLSCTDSLEGSWRDRGMMPLPSFEAVVRMNGDWLSLLWIAISIPPASVPALFFFTSFLDLHYVPPVVHLACALPCAVVLSCFSLVARNNPPHVLPSQSP